MPHQLASVACFAFWRENWRAAFWDFCNTIAPKADIGFGKRSIEIQLPISAGHAKSAGSVKHKRWFML
jgi:hypothetical protein